MSWTQIFLGSFYLSLGVIFEIRRGNMSSEVVMHFFPYPTLWALLSTLLLFVNAFLIASGLTRLVIGIIQRVKE